MKVSWDYDIPNIWNNKIHVPNHQPNRVRTPVATGWPFLTCRRAVNHLAAPGQCPAPQCLARLLPVARDTQPNLDQTVGSNRVACAVYMCILYICACVCVFNVSILIYIQCTYRNTLKCIYHGQVTCQNTWCHPTITKEVAFQLIAHL